MSKYSLIVYMVMDELKLLSDDALFNEDHIIFLADKYRAFLLKQKYSDIKKLIPYSNYLTVCLDLELVNAIDDTPCTGGVYLRSVQTIPDVMLIGNSKVTTIDYFLGEIAYVSRERLKYVGYNKYLKNIIYCALGPDNYLYFKSNNPQHLYLGKAKFTGIFEDSEEAAKLSCSDSSDSTSCDTLDKDFPLEDALVPSLIELIVKELLGSEYRPKDDENNAKDDLSDLATFLSRNTKSALAKTLE